MEAVASGVPGQILQSGDPRLKPKAMPKRKGPSRRSSAGAMGATETVQVNLMEADDDAGKLISPNEDNHSNSTEERDIRSTEERDELRKRQLKELRGRYIIEIDCCRRGRPTPWKDPCAVRPDGRVRPGTSLAVALRKRIRRAEAGDDDAVCSDLD